MYVFALLSSLIAFPLYLSRVCSIAELEYVSVSKRSLVANLSLAISLTVGCSYQPWLLKYLGDWKIWHHILYAQTIVVIAAPW